MSTCEGRLLVAVYRIVGVGNIAQAMETAGVSYHLHFNFAILIIVFEIWRHYNGCETNKDVVMF